MSSAHFAFDFINFRAIGFLGGTDATAGTMFSDESGLWDFSSRYSRLFVPDIDSYTNC